MASVIIQDGSVRSYDGSVVLDGGGAPCCCGGCEYYRANLCQQSCIEAPLWIYVCTTATCTNPNGTYTGPVVNNTIIKVGPFCYKVSTATRYCRLIPLPGGGSPGGPGDAVPCVPIRDNAPIVEVNLLCHQTCAPPTCNTVVGYFKSKYCSNTPQGNSPTYYLCCESVLLARTLFGCPVFSTADGCVYVEPNETPIPQEQVPNGSVLYCPQVNPNVNVHANCCGCSSQVQPGCCRCTTPSLLKVYRSDCNPPPDVGAPQCHVWRDDATVVIGGSYIVEQFRPGEGWCGLIIVCYQPGGTNRVKVTTTPLRGDCGPGAQTFVCSASGCNASTTGFPFGDPTVEFFDVVPCAGGCQQFGLQGLFQSPSGGQPGCCAVGSEYCDCKSFQNIWTQDNSACVGSGAQRTRACAVGNLFSSVGHCGDDNCGGGLLVVNRPGISLLDGTVPEMNKVKDGCGSCGGEKGVRI